MAASPLHQRTWSVGLASHLNLLTLPLHANQILASAAVYQVLFAVASPLASRAVFPDAYNKLSPKSRASWDARVVSFVQAAYITSKALHVILTDPTRPSATLNQRLYGYSSPAGKLQAYAAGYFLWDLYVSTRYMSQFGPSAAVHAVVALTISLLGFKPFVNYYGVNLVLYELSTPFLNVHWMLDKLGYTGSNLQLYNGIALVSTFFGCRLVWGSYQTWRLFSDMLAAWQTGPVPKLLFGTYLVSNATLIGLNFFWFGKMIQALKKRFQPTRSKPKSDGER